MVILKSFDGFIGKHIFNMFCSFYVYEHFGGNKNLLLNLCFIYFIENRQMSESHLKKNNVVLGFIRERILSLNISS